MKVRVGYMDGRHWLEPYTDGHAKANLAYVEVSDEFWSEYKFYKMIDRHWQDTILILGNEQYAKDHKKEFA